MPRFNLAFLESSFRPQLELLLGVPDMAEKVVILSGLVGEEAVYPPADDGYTGLRPRDLIEDDDRLISPRVVTLSPRRDQDDEPSDPPVTLISLVNVHSQVESQTENWARRVFGTHLNVVTCRAHRPDASLELCAHEYLERHRSLGPSTAILWPVYRTPVLKVTELVEHLAYHRSRTLRHGCTTTLGESLLTDRLVDVSS